MMLPTDLETHTAGLIGSLLQLPHTAFFSIEFVYKSSYVVQVTVNKNLPAIAVLVHNGGTLDVAMSQYLMESLSSMLERIVNPDDMEAPTTLPAFMLERGLRPRVRPQLVSDLAEALGEDEPDGGNE